MEPHWTPVLAAFGAYVDAWLADKPLDPCDLLDLFDGDDRDDLADLIDGYLQLTQHYPPVTDEAREAVARIIAMSDRMDSD